MQAVHSDDGIVLRLPDIEYEGGMPDLADLLVLDPATVEAEITAEIGGSAVFASRFRECAARALLLPRRQIGSGSPCGSSVSGRPNCSRWRRSTRPSRSSPRRSGSASPTCSMYRRWST